MRSSSSNPLAPPASFVAHATRWLALGLAASLAACGGDEPKPAAAPAAQTAATQAPAGAAPAAVPAAAAPVPVDELLRSASAAVGEERLVAPAGNNAVEYYLAVIDQEKNNVQATQALVDIFPLVASIAEREIAQRKVDEAERIVALLDRASEGSYTVTTLKAKVVALRASSQREADAQLAAQAAAEAAAAAAARPAAPETVTETEAEPAAAAPAPAVASTSGPRPATPAATPTPAPAAPATAPAAAPAAAAAAPTSSETREARAVRQVPPEYPTQAARKRQQGWVELEFTIGVDGKVKNVSVVRSQPTRVFDREAIRAMQQWTFEPAVQNGQPVESRKRRRMEFTL